jgi:hypothetical protein
MSIWTATALSAAAWLAVAAAGVAYRRITPLGGNGPAAAALGLLGVAACALTVVTALGVAYPNGQLSRLRGAAAAGAVAAFLLFAVVAARSLPAARTFRYAPAPIW